MIIPVAWVRTASSWDTAFPRYVLFNAAACESFLLVPDKKSPRPDCGPVGVFVIPGQHSLNDYDLLNSVSLDFERVVFVINGDEEALFRADKLEHPNKKVWWFTPPFNPKQKVDRVAPFGWPVGAPEMIHVAKTREHFGRDLPWFFAGQVTHARRQKCRLAAWQLPKEGMFIGTQGFTQGIERGIYYEYMVRSKFVLCPSGPHTVDTFRFAEALEAGCIPIVENGDGYWDYVFGGDPLPFPITEDWSDIPDRFEQLLQDYERIKPTCDYWWVLQKQKFIAQMKEDLSEILITGWITK